MLVTVIILAAAIVFGALFYASYHIGSGVYVRAFCRGVDSGRVVALTFDDGPDPATTPAVLDILKGHGIKAAFFVIGSKCRGNEHIIKRMHDEGHIVGNHGFNHRWNFPLLPASSIVRELEMADAAIKAATGYGTVYFRPPFGVTDPMVGKAVRETGLKVVGWSVRSLDTCMKGDSAKTVGRVMGRVHDGAVILLHDRLPECPVTLNELIRRLDGEKYGIVRFDELNDRN